MIGNTIYDELKLYMDESRIRTDEPMSRHTTFKTGGCADFFVESGNEEELKNVLAQLKREVVPYFVLGNGSNILVSDLGYNGVIVEIGHKMADIKVEGDLIHAGAGALLSAVARVAYENSLTGLEFASGIPGSVGGAVYMNAGAYGGEMKDVVTKVNVLDRECNGKTLSNDEMEFGYRSSVIGKEKYTVTGVTFKLSKGDKNTIKAQMDNFNFRRRDKQPLEYPSAGSTFKRPEGYFAGELIMNCGLKGFKIGGASVSEKHAGFVINHDNATSSDVYEVIKAVTKAVYEKYGVALEREVILLGEFK